MNNTEKSRRLTAFEHRLYNHGMSPEKSSISRTPKVLWAFSFTMTFLMLSLFPTSGVLAKPPAGEETLTPAMVIEAVNALRENNGLNTLSVHPVLMKVAQMEADGIASGSAGHWRPTGLTLGQWLISLGYPLSGDLTQDGYRSENWITAKDAKSAINAWKGDAEHANTMLSPNRSDIGVGIAISDQVYVVLVTALQTASGKMQSNAYPILTQAAASPGEGKGFMPFQYINPVIVATARPNGDVVHKLQYGQSLWSIAVAYHTTVDQLRAWNNLGEDITVYENQWLLVQRNATQPPPVTNTPIVTSTTQALIGTPESIIPLSVASPTVTITPSPTVASQEISKGAIPNEWRIGIIILLVGLAGLMSLFVIQKAK